MASFSLHNSKHASQAFWGVAGLGFNYNLCLFKYSLTGFSLFSPHFLKFANPFFLFLSWLQESCTVKKFQSWELALCHTLNALLRECYTSKNETVFVSCHLETVRAVGTTNRRSWMRRALPFLKNLSLQNNMKCSGKQEGFYWKPSISSCAKGGSVSRPPLDSCEPASSWCSWELHK